MGKNMSTQKNKKRYKIGVFGSDAGDSVRDAAHIAKSLGAALGKAKATVITGACSSLPYIAASEAHKLGSKVWGFSPKTNLAGQKKFAPYDDIKMYSRIIYVSKSFPFLGQERALSKYRNVISTATCEAGIVISGRWGSLNEFTNLFDMGKVVGVLPRAEASPMNCHALRRKYISPGRALWYMIHHQHVLYEKCS